MNAVTIYGRRQGLDGLGTESAFPWGPRQTGKSTLLRQLFPDSPVYDLLLSNEYARLNARPSLLREELAGALSGTSSSPSSTPRSRISTSQER